MEIHYNKTLYQAAQVKILEMVGVAGEIASFMMFDAIKDIEKTPLYQKDVKKNCKNATKAMEDFKEYVKKLYSNGNPKYIAWLTLTDNMQERVKKHVSMLHQTIWNVMTKAGINNGSLLAKIETVDTLYRLAVYFYDTICENAKKMYKVDFSKDFLSMSMKGVQGYWAQVRKYSYQNLKCGTDLNKDKDIKKALSIVADILTDEDIRLEIATDAVVSTEGVNIKEKELAQKVLQESKEQKAKKENEIKAKLKKWSVISRRKEHQTFQAKTC